MSTWLNFVVLTVISLVYEVVPLSKYYHLPMAGLAEFLCMTFKEDVLSPKLRLLAARFMHSICSPFFGIVAAPSIYNSSPAKPISE